MLTKPDLLLLAVHPYGVGKVGRGVVVGSGSDGVEDVDIDGEDCGYDEDAGCSSSVEQ